MASETKTFTCDDCGRSFGTVQALGKHRVVTHGAPPTRASRAKNGREASGLMAEVLQDVAAIVAPLRQRRAEIDDEIAVELEKLNALREARRVISNALKPFEPKATPRGVSHPNSNYHADQDKAKLDATRAFLLEHPEVKAFTRNQLSAIMRDAKVNPYPSVGKLTPIIETLRDEGLIRAGKVIKGGGLQYIVIREGGTNGTA